MARDSRIRPCTQINDFCTFGWSSLINTDLTRPQLHYRPQNNPGFEGQDAIRKPHTPVADETSPKAPLMLQTHTHNCPECLRASHDFSSPLIGREATQQHHFVQLIATRPIWHALTLSNQQPDAHQDTSRHHCANKLIAPYNLESRRLVHGREKIQDNPMSELSFFPLECRVLDTPSLFLSTVKDGMVDFWDAHGHQP